MAVRTIHAFPTVQTERNNVDNSNLTSGTPNGNDGARRPSSPRGTNYWVSLALRVAAHLAVKAVWWLLTGDPDWPLS